MQYVLHTWIEKRERYWYNIPYKGGPVDGSENGSASGTWEIYVDDDRPEPYNESCKCYRLSHTEKVEVSMIQYSHAK